MPARSDSKTQQHTPGPWRTSIEYRAPGIDAVDIVSDYAAVIVGQANFGGDIPDADAAANARLIAAAPALLEALQRYVDADLAIDSIKDQARAAIQQATNGGGGDA